MGAPTAARSGWSRGHEASRRAAGRRGARWARRSPAATSGPLGGTSLRGEPAVESVRDWSFLEPRYAIEIETRAPSLLPSAQARFVVQDGVLWLYAMSDADFEYPWVRRLRDVDPGVTIAVDGKLYPARAVLVERRRDARAAAPGGAAQVPPGGDRAGALRRKSPALPGDADPPLFFRVEPAPGEAARRALRRRRHADRDGAAGRRGLRRARARARRLDSRPRVSTTPSGGSWRRRRRCCSRTRRRSGSRRSKWTGGAAWCARPSWPPTAPRASAISTCSSPISTRTTRARPPGARGPGAQAALRRLRALRRRHRSRLELRRPPARDPGRARARGAARRGDAPGRGARRQAGSAHLRARARAPRRRAGRRPLRRGRPRPRPGGRARGGARRRSTRPALLRSPISPRCCLAQEEKEPA